MRLVRLALVVAGEVCWACLATSPAIASNAWSDLWRTPDQQGQALLDAGQPALAAGRFHDPRRRAYAALESGGYREAARLLQPYSDAESDYNRGNALAKSGQLQAALAAYDAALKQAPADEDIRHNRELVERALRQQHQSSQSSAQNGRQGGGKSGSAGQGQRAGQSAAGRQGGRGSPQAGGASGQGSESGNSGASSPTPGQLASNGSGRPNGTDGSYPRSGTGYDSGNMKEPAGQARRDAAEAAAYARQQQRAQRRDTDKMSQTPGSDRNGSPGAAQAAKSGAPHGSDAGDLVDGGAHTPKHKPETERQLALDQWLRQIPDSPAGLLQRKFLIEHMLKQQQQSGEAQGEGP